MFNGSCLFDPAKLSNRPPSCKFDPVAGSAKKRKPKNRGNNNGAGTLVAPYVDLDALDYSEAEAEVD